MSITINAAFDSGNIVVDWIKGTEARLSIRKDRESDFYQWFHFRLTCEIGDSLKLTIADLPIRLLQAAGPIMPYAPAPTANIGSGSTPALIPNRMAVR